MARSSPAAPHNWFRLIGVDVDRRQDTQRGQRDDGPGPGRVALVLVVVVVGPGRRMRLLRGRLPPGGLGLVRAMVVPPGRLRRGDLPPRRGAASMKGRGPRREGRREERSHAAAGSAPDLRARRARGRPAIYVQSVRAGRASL